MPIDRSQYPSAIVTLQVQVKVENCLTDIGALKQALYHVYENLRLTVAEGGKGYLAGAKLFDRILVDGIPLPESLHWQLDRDDDICDPDERCQLCDVGRPCDDGKPCPLWTTGADDG
jgi:hypothetical protein